MKRKLFILVFLFVFLLSACGQTNTAEEPEEAAEDAMVVSEEAVEADEETADAEAEAADGNLRVTVSIVPQQYFVNRIGGDLVDVTVMVEPGQSPATYEPKAEQMVALTNSDAYISIGVPFESSWLEKIQAANEDMLMVDTTQGIDRHENSSGGFDPHIWLSPSLVKIQSETIYAALAELDPDHADDYKANLDEFIEDIDALDQKIRTALENVEMTKFIVFHPAWGYFATDYGLEQISIEVGGQEPSAQELAELITLAETENIKVIFVQPEFSQEDAKTIAAEIGGEVLPISPLNADWLENLNLVANTFASVLND